MYIARSKDDGKTMIFTDGSFFGNDFRLDGVDYERDEYNGRFYRLDTSNSLTSKVSREGGFVRRRISKEEYIKALRKAVKEFGFNLSSN